MLLLSVVLNMGDVKFEPRGNNDAAQITNWDLLRKGNIITLVPDNKLYFYFNVNTYCLPKLS